MTRATTTLSILTAITLAGALTACAAEHEQLPIDPPSPSPSATAPQDETPAPLGTSITGIPVDLGCDQLLSLDAIYDYNPNVGADPGHTPSALAQQALGYGGVSCGWINQTSSVTLSVAVAQFDPASLDVVREAASAKAGAVDLNSADGFFRATSVGGVAEAFIGDYWVIVESPALTTVGDVDELLLPLVDSLS